VHLSIAATSTDGPDHATTTVGLDVTVNPVADAPTLTLAPATNLEDNAVSISITQALADTDGSEHLGSVTISGVPSWGHLNQGAYDAATDTWTLSQSDLSGLQFIPDANRSGTATLTVTATSTEGANGSAATTTGTMTLTVTPVADAPTASASNETGVEDTAIPLHLGGALTDVDGSEALTLVIENVPTGATFNHGVSLGGGKWSVGLSDLSDLAITPPANFSGTMNLTLAATSTEAANGSAATTSVPFTVSVTAVADTPTLAVNNPTANEDTPAPLTITTSLADADGSEILSVVVSGVPAGYLLSAGTNNHDGSWTLTPAQLSGLTIIPPTDHKDSFELTVTATSTEKSNSDSAHVTVEHIPVVFTAVADKPSLTVTPATGLEDTQVALNISTTTTDQTGTEVIDRVVISGVPTGATLSAGINNGGGTWTLTQDQLVGLMLNPKTNSNKDFNLTVTTWSKEPSNGSTASNTATLRVNMVGDADEPNLTTHDATVNEDSWVKLDFTGSLNDTDGSETLTYVISGLPAGARLDPATATLQSDGTWKVTAANAGNVRLLPPANYSGDFTLTVTAVATENDGDVARKSGPVNVHVEAVGDAPAITVLSETGLEDQVNADGSLGIPLHLTATVTDNSEHISQALIKGVPSGFTVVGGTDLGGGVWEVSPDHLAEVTLKAPQDYSGTVTGLTFEATSMEPNGSTATTTSPSFSVTFTAVADTPAVAAQNVTGPEDTAIPMNLSAAVTDVDLSETLAVQISGVPTGATLNHGTDLGGGVWSVATADLASLTITPPRNFSGDISLRLTAVSTETSNASTAENHADFTVHVSGVADTPYLNTIDVLGNEDTAIGLRIVASLGDTDGSESLYVEITGAPAGSTFNHGSLQADGSWRVAAADLADLTITPPHDSNVDFQLSVRSLAIESDYDPTTNPAGLTYSEAKTITVTVAGVPDTPTLVLSAAHGNEDTAIRLNFHAESTDTDPAAGRTQSETISYVVSGLPTGASLNHGLYIGSGKWSVTEAEMEDLTVTPATNFSGTFNLNVTVVVQENDGRESHADHTLTVTVDPVVDATLRGGLDGVSKSYGSASGNEDTSFHINVDPGLTDTDGSEKVLYVEVSGVPDGVKLLDAASYLTPDENGVYKILPSQFASLRVEPPANSGDDFDLTVKAYIQDSNGQTTVSNTAQGPLHVVVNAVADTPTITAGDISGTTHTNIAANIHGALTDTDGSESLNYIITGLAGTGIVPTAGVNLGGGSFLVTSAQMANLSFTHLGGTLPTGPVTVQAYAVATESENGSQALASDPFTITVNAGSGGPGGDPGGGTTDTPPTVDVAVTTAAGSLLEDHAVTLNITAHFGSDGSEYGIVISGLPAGARPSEGFYNPLGNGSWIIPADALNNVTKTITITPPHDFAGTMTFDVTAAKTGGAGDTLSATASPTVDLAPVVDTPSVYLGASSGNEDVALNLNLHASATDSSEAVTAVVVSGLPAGATLTGSGILSHDAAGYHIDPAHLSDVSFVPPANAHGSYSFTVTTTVADSATYSSGSTASATSTFTNTMNVKFTAVADAANLTAANVTGNEGAGIPLSLTAALADTDGSEVMAVVISGLPDGAMLSAGSNNGDHSWTLSASQLAGLKFFPPAYSSGDYHLTITAYTLENSDGSTATSSKDFTVHVDGVANKVPTIAIDTTGAEDHAIPLTIDYTQVDTDGSETVTAVLTGIPVGSQLSRGEYHAEDNSWRLTGADLKAGLSLTPPTNFSGTINIAVAVTTTENDTGHNSVTTQDHLTVTVTPVADAPDLIPVAAVGDEDHAVALNLGAALTDTDGSETLSVTIAGVPEWGHLSAGTHNADGTWTLTQAQLAGLAFIPDADKSGTATLTITATSTEGANHDAASTTATLSLTVTPVADAPTLTVANASGTEDDASVPLSIASALTDTDGSETLSVTVTGVPAWGHLSAGVHNADGSWTLTPDQLADLKFIPDANASGEATLHVTATSTEGANGVAASTSADLHLSVAAVADAPTLTLANASGTEDAAAVPLAITSALTDTDGSETLSVTVTGVPAWGHLSAGVHNADGSWTLTPDQLADLTFIPDANASGTATLHVTATSTEGATGLTASTSADLHLSVAAVADAPTLSAGPAYGNEDTAIALNIASELTDSSESLSVTIAGVPTGATLSAGTHNADGTWTLTADQLHDLTLTPVQDMSGTLHLDITATSTDGTSHASTSVGLDLAIHPVADPVSLAHTAFSGSEDTAISLDLHPVFQDADGSESLSSLVVSGLPEGATLNHGTHNADGTWTLHAGDLDGLTVTPPENFHDTMTLHLDLHTTDSAAGALDEHGAAMASHDLTSAFTVSVDVAHVADTPTLATAEATGTSGTDLHLDIQAVSPDHSETVSVSIAGVPEGLELNHGVHETDGSWTVASADLGDLNLTHTDGFTGDLTLTVTAHSQDGTSHADSAPATLAVHLDAAPEASASLMSFSLLSATSLEGASTADASGGMGAGGHSGLDSGLSHYLNFVSGDPDGGNAGHGLSNPEVQDYASTMHLDPTHMVLPPTPDEIQVLSVLDGHTVQPTMGLDHQTAEAPAPDPGHEHAALAAPEGLHDSSTLDHPLDGAWHDQQHHV
jgi:hypothetical protein